VRNNERYLAFSPAVPQAFLEVSDLWVNFYFFTFSMVLSIYSILQSTVVYSVCTHTTAVVASEVPCTVRSLISEGSFCSPIVLKFAYGRKFPGPVFST
jgi:hypothetical protein